MHLVERLKQRPVGRFQVYFLPVEIYHFLRKGFRLCCFLEQQISEAGEFPAFQPLIAHPFQPGYHVEPDVGILRDIPDHAGDHKVSLVAGNKYDLAQRLGITKVAPGGGLGHHQGVQFLQSGLRFALNEGK